MCKARRVNDQMMCECGLTWDVADSEPPRCPRTVVVKCDGYSTDEHKMADDWQRERPVKCDGYSTDEGDDQ